MQNSNNKCKLLDGAMGKLKEDFLLLYCLIFGNNE